MKFKRLELFGFKSFLNRTVFHLNEGITSIVGPNGCGKSNIVDAIVWALGERGTKSLRVKDMGDVIFHGSNGRRPVNIAEVSVELEDMDKEYTIKRRIYRDGVNEYLLNGKQVRLKDIQDFLLGTGIGLNSYAIVEQGKIEHFIQMNPHERRVVIEEVSGITRFEEKKREAISRLEEVRVNLERAEDIHGEVVSSLEKASVEWKRWKDYKALVEKNAQVESWILTDGYIRLTKRMQKSQDRQSILEKEFTIKEEEVVALKLELGAKEKEFSLAEGTLRKLEVDIKGKEKDMESKLLEIDYLNKDNERLQKETVDLLRKEAGIGSNIKRIIEEIGKARDEKEKLEDLLKVGDEKFKQLAKTMGELKNSIGIYERHIDEERNRLFVTMSTITDIKNTISAIERLTKEKERRELKKIEDKKKLTELLNTLEMKHKGLDGSLSLCKNEIETIKTKTHEASGLRDSFANYIAKTKGIMETLRGEKKGREEFLKQMSNLQEVKKQGPPDTKKLIDLIRVDEGKEKALERFFYREMDYYVLPEGGKEPLIDKIRKYHENFIFFPVKGMTSFNNNEVTIGVRWIESAEDAIDRIERGEEGIFLNEDLMIDSRGFILQERAAKKIDIKRFQEKRRIEKELKEIESEYNKHLVSLREMEAKYKQHNDVYSRLRSELDKNVEYIKVTEKEIAVLDTEIRTTRERLQELESRIDFTEDTVSKTPEELYAEKEGHEINKGIIEEKIKTLREMLEKTKRQHETISAQWHEISIDNEQKKNLIKKQLEDVEQKQMFIARLKEDKKSTAQKMESIRGDIEQNAKKIALLEKDYDELKAISERHIEHYEGLKSVSGTIHTEKHAINEKLENTLKEIEKIRIKNEAVEKEMAILNEKRCTIFERLQTTFGISEPQNINIPQDIDLDKEKEAIDKKILQLGEVNFRAEKEYEELRERALFLEKQKEDLRIAMDSLKKTIIKIDSLSREIFSETFEMVNSAFKGFTDTLFRGGRGYLALSQDNIGVEMYIQPPGKRIIRMELLSGGEKTLVSLGFLLALMDTKPSPFSLMDEIDAPLDDANLISLMQIIQQISRKTQIIFITHNRITMESSHTIYGITMEEEGISKVVSVRL